MLVRVIIEHFPNRPHHQIHEKTRQHVNQDDRRTSQTNRAPRPQEKTRADGSSNGYNLNMPIL